MKKWRSLHAAFDDKANRKRISQLNGMLDTLEERYVLNGITREQYNKFSEKYR